MDIFWRKIETDKSYRKEDKVLILSPSYKTDNSMKYRIIDSQFVDICNEATHWAKLDDKVEEK